MVDKTGLISELQFLSDKLSDRSRVIAGGIIAIWWATLVGEKTPPMGLNATALLGPVVCAALTILFDVLQYVVGYLQYFFALRQLERGVATDYKFDKGDPFVRTRTGLFVVKQIAAVSAACWLIAILLRRLWP
jgi:hypothetical protein